MDLCCVVLSCVLIHTRTHTDTAMSLTRTLIERNIERTPWNGDSHLIIKRVRKVRVIKTSQVRFEKTNIRVSDTKGSDANVSREIYDIVIKIQGSKGIKK